MNICLFSPDEIAKPLSFKDERGEHIIKILHKKEGDTFLAGIINGSAGKATITKIQDKQIFFNFEPDFALDAKPLFPLKMIIGFPRPIQLKRLLRDIAALGVCEVYLTGTELGEKSYMKSNVVESGAAYKMLLDGTVQAGGTFVPKLFLHQNLKECLSAIFSKKSDNNQQNQENQLKLCLDNVNPTDSLVNALKNQQKLQNQQEKTTEIFAAIGSERGWTNAERTLLEQNGFILCGMGNRIMRTETAATVSASVICASQGWLE